MKCRGLVFSMAAAGVLALGGAAQASFVTEVAADNPLNWYRFEETSGTTAVDSGSEGANATYTNGVTLNQAGMPGVGQAVSFDGVDDHVATGLANLSGSWTAEFVMLYDQTSSPATAVVISSGGGVGGLGLKVEQWLDTEELGYTEFGVADEQFVGATTPSGFAHVVFVNTGAQMEAYINGALAGTNANLANLGRFRIGGGINQNNIDVDFFPGLIDEAVIYDKALSANDVARHFNAIPEPASMALLGLGGLLMLRRRRA